MIKKILLLFFMFIVLFSIFNISLASDNYTFFCEKAGYDVNLSLDTTNFENDYYLIAYTSSSSTNLSFLIIRSSSQFSLLDKTGSGSLYINTKGDSPVYYGFVYNQKISSNSPNVSIGLSRATSEFSLDTNISSFTYTYIYSDIDIVDLEGNVIYGKTKTFIEPKILNTEEELSTGKFDYLRISSGDFNSHIDNNAEFYLFSYYYNEDTTDVSSLYPRKEIFLDGSWNKYYVGLNNDGQFIYEIPFGELGISLEEGKQYGFKLASKDDEGNVIDYYSDIVFTVGVLSDTDKQLNSDKLTQGLLGEQNETNKNIFERIGELLSYINPFSENFFVYKLIELLIDMLKSLFVPQEGFFNNWLDDLNTYFGDRFGILYYPFELVIDFFNRVSRLSDYSGSSIMHIPDLKFMDTILIHSFDYDFNSLLVNDTFKNIHDIYLVVVDVILWLMLIVLSVNTFVEVFGGKFADEVIADMTSDERSYQNYERHQQNRVRYQSSHENQFRR